MMTAVVEQRTDSQVKEIPPSVLLVGKKRTMDYVSPALHRLNDTGELVIKATGSLSIVTAVDVAEIVKRDVASVATQSIAVGTDELRVATGELKRMSCIEIHLIKVSPIVPVPDPDFHVPVEEPAIQTPMTQAVEIPIEDVTPAAVEVPVIVAVKTKKATRKSPAAKKKKSTKKSTKKKTVKKIKTV
jgi:DNA-binding protein Alba